MRIASLLTIVCLILLPPAQAEAPRPLDDRLRLELVAAEPDIVTPTGLAVDARGRIFVIESHTHFRPENYDGPPADRIRVFEDTDGDTKADRVTTFFEGTTHTMALAFAPDGSLVAATRAEVFRLQDRDNDGRADEPRTTLARLETKGDYPHNGLCGVALDPAGSILFGLGENLGAPYRLIAADGSTLEGGGEGGNIYRMGPDGSKLHRVATGFWNPFALAFDPFGRLFAVDNDPDSRPPCRLLHIVEQGDYGYRFRNGRKGVHPFTSWNGELPGTLPMVAGTGEAPSGLVVYESVNLPDEYRGSLLATSWGDHRIERYRLQPRGASFVSTMEPVVTGNEDFRPVALAVAPDGSLVFSDWVDKSYDLHRKGRIWRLRGSKPGRSSDTRTIAPKDGSPEVRAEAMRRLADPDARDTLLAALESDDPFLRQAARVGLGRSLPVDHLLKLAADPSPARRLGVLLTLRDTGRPEARAALPKALSDPDPDVRFVAVEWIAEARLTEFQEALRQGLADSSLTRSLFEAHLAALERLDGRKRTLAEEVGGQDYIASLVIDPSTPPVVLRRALRSLRPDHPDLAIERLQRFIASSDPVLRLEAVRTLRESSHSGKAAILAALATDVSQPTTLRAESVAGLQPDDAESTERLVELATEADAPLPVRLSAARSLRGASLDEAQRHRLAADPRIAPTFDPRATSVDRPKLGDLDAWLARLDAQPGDPAEGERVFFHPKGPGCYRCHRVDGRGGQAGPELTTAAPALTRRRLVESIVRPSQEIAPQFVPWLIARRDGTVATGLLVEEAIDGTQTYADSTGQTFTIRPDQIAERRPSASSLMPDDLPASMTIEEFRDLAAFLQGRTGPVADHP
jgi:putative membrane-bound dehydrogenase-like protein